MASNLEVKVERIEGKCGLYEKGDKFLIEQGWLLASNKPVCLHALASLMPCYVALANGVDPAELGLTSKDGLDPGAAYVRCFDPCDITGGGSVTFRISTIE